MIYRGDERCEEREEYDAQGDGIVTDEEYSGQRNERQSEAAAAVSLSLNGPS